MKMFRNKRFITKGVLEHIEPLLQVFMWQCIDNMPPPKDYLQVFKLTAKDHTQHVTHSQEEPAYEHSFDFRTDEPITAKIFVIDDETHSTMLLAEEY